MYTFTVVTRFLTSLNIRTGSRSWPAALQHAITNIFIFSPRVKIWTFLDPIKMNKTNRCTEFQFYWYDNSTCFGATFLPIIRSSELYISFGTLYAVVSRMLPGVGCHPTPRSIWSPQLPIMYQSRRMAQNSWWWAERLPETCRVVIPIKLEFSASVGFIHFILLWCTIMRT
jgi:hypothetical protein